MMKILAILIGVMFTAFLAQSETSEVYLGSFDTTRVAKPTYYVPSDRLSKGTSWVPESGAFPVSLGIASRAAEDQVKKVTGITNDLTLNQISLERIKIPNSGNGSLAQSNQWRMLFQFTMQPKGGVQNTVMLLDGTFVLGRSYHAASKQQSKITTRSNTNLSDSIQVENHRDAPWAGFHKADFEIPMIQWSPEAGEFPLNIDANIKKCREIILRQGEIRSLLFEGLTIQHDMPMAAIKSQNLGMFEHLNHCWVSFRFKEAGAENYTIHEVIMLLDGRILGQAAKTAP